MENVENSLLGLIHQRGFDLNWAAQAQDPQDNPQDNPSRTSELYTPPPPMPTMSQQNQPVHISYFEFFLSM